MHPRPDALQFAQDKILMREKLTELGVPVPAWAAVTNEAELQEFIDTHGGRAVAKTARGGYDGKGVRAVSYTHLDVYKRQPWEVLSARVRAIVEEGRAAPGHVFNLGHGVLPHTDPDVITRVVELVLSLIHI